MRVISIQVPDGASPGDVLSFTVEGNELEIPVPEGTVSGDTLQIQVGGEEATTHATESESTKRLKIGAFGGKTLTIHTAERYQSEETSSCDGTFALPWRASSVLAQFLASASSVVPDLTPGVSILELGSGLGIGGLSFGARYKEIIGKLVLSDYQPALQTLAESVSTNKEVLPNTEVLQLEWSTSPSQIPEEEQYDWIIGSDVLYNTDSIPALVKTIQMALKPGGCLLLSIRWRKPDNEREFFRMLENAPQKTKWKLICGKSVTAWQEYGGPSDQFFHKTLVSVDGKPKALGYISERDLEAMTKEEYDAWDELQVQLYLGECST